MITIRRIIRIFEAESQHGTAIIMALLILLVLSVIGISAVSTSTVETKITGVERGYQEAFYTADSGEPIGVELVKYILQNDPQDLAALGSPWSGVTDSSLIGMDGEIFTDSRNTYTIFDASPNSDVDLNSRNDGNNLGLSSYTQLLVDIDRLKSHHLAGGGIEFAAGYEGIGMGGGGDIAILYAVDSVGRYSMRGAQSRVYVGYRHVPGLAGGE
jgi:type II secretory pathway component PulK